MYRIFLAFASAILLSVALATPAHAATWAWCSSDPEGTWQIPGGPDGTDYFVQNDMWNSDAGPQTICANSASDVQVTSNQPTGNTAIEAYPDVGALYTGGNLPVSGFKSIASHYTENFPADVIGEAANDVWLNNWSTEIMIWVDTHNEDPSWLPQVGTWTYGTQTFRVFLFGSDCKAAGAQCEIIFYLPTNTPSGTTHVLSAIRWVIGHGYAPASSGITEAEFGWEIAGTNGPEVFDLTSYKLSAPCKTGVACATP